MKLGDLAVKAVKDMDPHSAGRLIQILTTKYPGFRYQCIYEFVCDAHKNRGLAIPTLGDWDAILYELNDEPQY